MDSITTETRQHRRGVMTLLALAVTFGSLLWLSSLGGSWAMSPDTVAANDTIPGCIVGQITVGGAQPVPGTIPLACQPYTVYVEICGQTIPGCTIPPCTIPVAADEYGQFVVCDIVPGTYDFLVRGLNTLANLRTAITVPEAAGIIPGTIPVDFGTLRPGDASGNNVVDILDFSILAFAYGSSSGAPGWDPRADFNCSGTIDILDFSLLATYYTFVGDFCNTSR